MSPRAIIDDSGLILRPVPHPNPRARQSNRIGGRFSSPPEKKTNQQLNNTLHIYHES